MKRPWTSRSSEIGLHNRRNDEKDIRQKTESTVTLPTMEEGETFEEHSPKRESKRNRKKKSTTEGKNVKKTSSAPPGGPNCLLAPEYRIETIMASFMIPEAKLQMFTLPPLNAPGKKKSA
jgi:hypothetical protein